VFFHTFPVVNSQKVRNFAALKKNENEEDHQSVRYTGRGSAADGLPQ
jgi:hypothetical protein